MVMVSKKLYIVCDLLWLVLLIFFYLCCVLIIIYCQIIVKENKQFNKGGWYQLCCVLFCQKCKVCVLKNFKKKKKDGGDYCIGGLYVVVVGNIGGCLVVGGEREGGKCDRGQLKMVCVGGKQ